MMQQKFAVTAGRNSGLQWQARAWAQGFGVPYLRRGAQRQDWNGNCAKNTA